MFISGIEAVKSGSDTILDGLVNTFLFLHEGIDVLEGCRNVGKVLFS